MAEREGRELQAAVVCEELAVVCVAQAAAFVLDLERAREQVTILRAARSWSASRHTGQEAQRLAGAETERRLRATIEACEAEVQQAQDRAMQLEAQQAQAQAQVQALEQAQARRLFRKQAQGLDPCRSSYGQHPVRGTGADAALGTGADLAPWLAALRSHRGSARRCLEP